MNVESAVPVGARPSVVLVFPPLVETNFGSYFPSTAVLAAYLETHDISTMQLDLNEEFALHLLERAGQLGGSDTSSTTAMAARWLAEHGSRLYDGMLRHDFGPTSKYGFLLQELAKPFLIDPSTKDVEAAAQQSSEGLKLYRDFFEQSSVLGDLPESVALFALSVPMGPQLIPSLILASLLKDVRPDARVILGGPTVSLMDLSELEKLLQLHRSVDCAVRFDGELPLLGLARQATTGDWRPHEIRGVSVLTPDGVCHSAPAPGPNLNLLPTPVYDARLLERLAQPVLGIVQARGCYWGKCDYCDFVELYDGSPPFRSRRPEHFVDEIAHQVTRHGIRRFTFITESIPPAFARRACRLLLDRDIQVSWESFAMVDRRFTKELLALMVEAGCEYLVIGLETTITRVLKLVHKSADRDENFRFLRDARDVGMRLRCNIIPDLPTTTYEEALQCLRDLEELSDCVESFAIFPFEATRSSNVGRSPDTFGLVPISAPTQSGQAQFAMNHLGNIDPAMTPDQRTEIYDLFTELSRRVNKGRDVEDDPSFLKAVPAPDEWVAFARSELDVIEQGNALSCAHVLTGERIIVPAAAVKALGERVHGGPFTLAALTEDVGPGTAAALIRNLIDARLLVTAQRVSNDTSVLAGRGAGLP